MRITGGRCVRVMFDSVGGDLLPILAKAISPNGLIYVFGASGGEHATIPLIDYIKRMLTLKGWTPRKDPLLDDARLGEAVTFISDSMRSGMLVPVIDRVFDFEYIVEAHRYLESAQQFGKIVVRV